MTLSKIREAIFFHVFKIDPSSYDENVDIALSIFKIFDIFIESLTNYDDKKKKT